VFEALAARLDHPTAEQVLADVRRRLPGLSRTSVYRVLDTLVDLGLVAKTCHPGGRARFDPNTTRHHHLVCVDCERIVDLDAPTLNRLRLPDTRAQGFEIHDYSVHIRGRCAGCRQRSRRRATAGKGGR